MKELDNEIENGLPNNIYMLFGEENYLIESYEKKMEDTILNKDNGLSDLNINIFDGNKTNPDDVYNAFSTLSFSTNRRFVKVIESELFFRGRNSDSDSMAKYLEEVPKDCLLLFIEKKVDKRNKLYKYIKKNGMVFEINTLKEDEILKWSMELIKKNNQNINKNTLIYLLRTSSYNMTNLKSEIEKLSDYIPNGTIEKKHIDDICNKSLEIKIFDLVKAIGNKDSKTALNIYSNMILMKESPIMILSMIGRQLKLILECKILQEEHLNAFDISKQINLNSFVVKECLSQSKNFSKISLYNGYKDVANMDVKIKTGKIKDTIGVELIISKYSI